LQVEFARLDGERLTLVFALEMGGPERGGADLVYLGARLPEGENLSALAASTARGRHESQPDAPPVPGLLPERKAGWSGTPAVSLMLAGKGVQTDFRVQTWTGHVRSLTIAFADRLTGLVVDQCWQIATAGVVRVRQRASNSGKATIALARLSSIAIPLPMRFAEVTSYSGRWTGEMRESRRAIAPEGFSRVTGTGKVGFGGNAITLHAPATGEVLGVQLAWSGDHEARIDCDPQANSDGRAVLQMGAVIEAGEIELPPGGGFECPEAVLAFAPDRNTLARQLHANIRAEVLPGRSGWGPRKVHINSWDALGINLSQDGLMRLADAAAQVGVERFVLDDGWFKGRRSTTSSLGDWSVCPDIFPDGLTPLIEHVQKRGMDFGLWVEPEMISPDSDLCRARPDWCLHGASDDRPTMRGQLLLDLTQHDAREHVGAQLDRLLEVYPIACLKWDHNRDLFPASQRFRQTEGFYQLIDQIREKHPHVEVECCAEGGGRIDFGVLARVHRVWPSDNNDAIERLRIIPAWSQFLPLEVLGSHVGPSPNPITGRRLAMDFRAKVAIFGHMGVEADPARMTDTERECLAAHIALYKAWRGVLHQGALWRLEHPDPNVTGMMVTHEGKALALAAQTAFSPVFDAAPVRLAGLEPEARYRVRLPAPWPPRARHYLANADAWREGLVLSGTALMTQGLALPLTHPETAWLVALEKIA
jgi:alpha-galactosidase